MEALEERQDPEIWQTHNFVALAEVATGDFCVRGCCGGRPIAVGVRLTGSRTNYPW